MITLRERLRGYAITWALVGAFGFFAVAFPLHVFPSILAPLGPLLCPDGSDLVGGHHGVPHSRVGTEGEAICVDAAGNEGEDVFAKAFFLVWGAFTLAVGGGLALGGELRRLQAGPRR